jgi:subfamily B ATP-binding cassette protein MsbA
VGRKGQEQMGDLYSVIQENVQAAAVVKAYTAERMESERFQKANHYFIDLGLRFAKADTLSSPLMEMVGALLLSILLWQGGEDVVRGHWSSGSFLVFIAYAVMTYRPLKNFSELNAQLQLGLASSERIFELLDESSSVREAPHAKPLPPFEKTISYEHVTFQYPTAERPALDDFSLTIRAGEMVALVGSSGAGKSTAALLLPRFYDIALGALRIDGRDIREMTLASLRGQIGYVTQDVLLFNESARYNISYGKPQATESEMIAAAEAANARTFIERLPEGYDTVIGERGVRLSGGERQRLSIARALLKNPPILILDEATSALDAESERLVQQALERLMEHRTALVIAHRLSTVRKADRIIVMEHGRLAEEGTHAALLQKEGIYHKLHNLQLLHV